MAKEFGDIVKTAQKAGDVFTAAKAQGLLDDGCDIANIANVGDVKFKKTVDSKLQEIIDSTEQSKKRQSALHR